MAIDPSGLEFPRTYWAKRLRSFVNLSNLDPAWKDIDIPAPPMDAQTVHAETDELIKKKLSGRKERIPEIIEEDGAITSKFARLLVMNDQSHPGTAEVLDAIIIAGRLAHFHFKDKFNRARPSQVEPEIDPVINVPNHPAYPSGHANQHRMFAMALSEFAPDYSDQLHKIANRVSENREFGGVHFASDTQAGFLLAEKFYPFLRKAYKDEFDRARAEWPNPAPAPF